MTCEIRLFGLSEETLRHRLADLLEDTSIEVTLSVYEGRGTVTLTAEPEALEELTAEVELRLGGYVYSAEGDSLAATVVELLTAHGLTVATAESCTGGLIAAALTDVPGASQVFGTGVVSYSNDCKQALLAVSPDTLSAVGAVSAETAGQMARGVRQTAGASIGVSVTGEAGPTPAEDHPVGTVFIALADKKRTWVEELHLDGPDRASIRRQAADHVLWLLWRYLSAYPAVMAGGETHVAVRQREIPRTQGAGQPRLLSRMLPWRGDSWRRILMKSTVWLLVLALLAGGTVAGYRYFIEPVRNRQLQDSLGDLYYESTDLTAGAVDSGNYPTGMLSIFRGLYDMNSDIGGWLHIPHTEIDYPVMNYTGGYYKNHSFVKQYSLYGQLYFGPSVSKWFYAVYGKNTDDNQMLSELLNYRRIAYLQEHPTIECNTVYETGTWQVFAVLVADDNDSQKFAYVPDDLETDEDFLAYVEQVGQRSLFTADRPVTAEDTLLILSTNAEDEYGFDGARFVVIARRVSHENTPVTYRVNYGAKMPSALNRLRSTTATTRRTTTTRTTATTATRTTTTTVATTTETAITDTTTVTVTDATGVTESTTDTTVWEADATTAADEPETTTATTDTTTETEPIEPVEE